MLFRGRSPNLRLILVDELVQHSKSPSGLASREVT